MKMVRRMTVALFAMVLMLSIAVPAFAAGTAIKLVNMNESFSEDVRLDVDSITSSYGKSYSGNILQVNGSGRITYELKGEYSSFSGKLLATENTGSSSEFDVAIYADGKSVYEYKGFTKQVDEQEISIDLTGVNILQIKIIDNNYSSAYICLVDGLFEKADTPSLTYPEWEHLNGVKLIDSSSYESSAYIGEDSYGNLHDTWNRFNTVYEAYALYNLNKEFETFTGYICASDRTASQAVMNIYIYCDEKLVLSEEGVTTQTKPIPFTIDVSNCSTLRVATSDENNYSSSYIYIEDSILSKHMHETGDEKITKAATCTDSGEKSWVCKVCGETVKTETIPALGHTPDGKWVTESEATCGEEGEQVQHCSVCKEICDTQKVDKLPHTPAETWEVSTEPRCDAEGLQVKKCTVCGEVCEEEAIPTVEHTYGNWEKVSGSVWNNPIVKERTCSICGDVEHVESNSTSWLKPLVIVLFVIIFGGLAVIIVTLKMNGLALEPASIKKLFSKESLTDDDIDDILNKPDDNSDNQ